MKHGKNFMEWDGTPEDWLACFGIKPQDIEKIKDFHGENFKEAALYLKPQYKCMIDGMGYTRFCEYFFGINPTQQ